PRMSLHGALTRIAPTSVPSPTSPQAGAPSGALVRATALTHHRSSCTSPLFTATLPGPRAAAIAAFNSGGAASLPFDATSDCASAVATRSRYTKNASAGGAGRTLIIGGGASVGGVDVRRQREVAVERRALVRIAPPGVQLAAAVTQRLGDAHRRRLEARERREPLRRAAARVVVHVLRDRQRRVTRSDLDRVHAAVERHRRRLHLDDLA